MWREKIYISIIVILIIVMITFIVLTQEDRKNLIDVGKCSKVLGEYAVDAGFESANVINLCGANNASVCSFTVSNLQDAFDICNTNSEKCSRFMYNEKLKIMSFINNIPSFKRNPNSSIYIRQGDTTT